MIEPNIKDLDEINSTTQINGLKLMLNCKKCGRRWAYWFSGVDDLQNNLPGNWYICQNCKNIDKEITEKENEKERYQNEY